MTFSEIDLPSNKKFGFFFTLVFAIAATYFYNPENMKWTYIFAATSVICLIVTLKNAEILLPLNKLWMKFGLLLGLIVSPIVLGIIFFGLFTPLSLFMRLSGRDELKLKFSQKKSHWISRNNPIKSDSYKNQF